MAVKVWSKDEQELKLRAKLIKAILKEKVRGLLFLEKEVFKEKLFGILKDYLRFDFVISEQGNDIIVKTKHEAKELEVSLAFISKPLVINGEGLDRK